MSTMKPSVSNLILCLAGFMVDVCSCKECSHHENESLTLARTKALNLTHTYPHNPLRKIEVTMCNHQQAYSPLYVWPDV